MKTIYNDKQGSRDRKSWCLMVLKDGTIHQFRGVSVPGICHVTETARQKWVSGPTLPGLSNTIP